MDRPLPRTQARLLAGGGGDPGRSSFASVFFAGFIVVTIGAGRTKKTGTNWIASLSGAIVNFGLNLYFIPHWGMLGAA